MRLYSSYFNYPGANPVYICGLNTESDNITSVQWLINGRQLEDLNLPNVEIGFNQYYGMRVLRFNSISVEYNNTNIQCRATFSNGETAGSNNVKLLVEEGER